MTDIENATHLRDLPASQLVELLAYALGHGWAPEGDASLFDTRTLQHLIAFAREHGYEPPSAPSDDTLGRARVLARKRDLNSRGRGEEFFRLGVLEDGSTEWLDRLPSTIIVEDDWCPRGVRASERRCSTRVEVDAGTLLISITREVGTRSRPVCYVGVAIGADGAVWETNDKLPFEHIGMKRGNVHVLKHRINGYRVEVSPDGGEPKSAVLALMADARAFARGYLQVRHG